MSGRVIFDGSAPKNYELYEGEMKPQSFQNSLQGIQDNNVLNKAFFSQRNINNIQKQIQRKVLEKTNYTIGRQSDLQLQIIMRSIFLSYGKNNNNNIQNQINELNTMVVEDCINKILPEIKQYLYYRKDITQPRQILPHSVNPSSSGEKTLGNSLFD